MGWISELSIVAPDTFLWLFYTLKRASILGAFPTLKIQFRASVISKGDTEKCMVGGRERHTPDAENFSTSGR
jgi:hypothetical protein